MMEMQKDGDIEMGVANQVDVIHDEQNDLPPVESRNSDSEVDFGHPAVIETDTVDIGKSNGHAVKNGGPPPAYDEAMNGHAQKDVASDKKGKEKEDEEKEKKESVEMIPFFSLFRFADGWDWILMFFGSIFGIGNGLGQPAFFIVFGDVISEFVNFGKNMDLAKMGYNQTEIDAIMKQGNVADALSKITTAGMEKLSDRVEGFAYVFIGVGCAMVVFGYLQCALWTITSVRMSHRIRLKFFDAILRQEVGWFDVNETGGLATRLADDILKIQNGLGDKVGQLWFTFGVFFGGFGIAFYYGWKLTLVILAVTPLMAITGGIMGKVMAGFTSQEQTAYALAGGVAEECFSSIRTVAAFGGEEIEAKRYADNLKVAEATGIKKNLLVGASWALVMFTMMCCYALAFWYGSTLITKDIPEMESGSLLIVFFCVLMGGMQLGQAQPIFEAMNVGRGAAHFIWSTISRESQIDPNSDAGEKPAQFVGNISFEDVHFRYPSRAEVKVLDGFSLNIDSGKTVALVGESGCGKSTIIKLVQRFYDPYNIPPSGEGVDNPQMTDGPCGIVKVDGRDIKTLNVAWLRKHIGVVSQEPVLFDMSIAENIRMGKNGATQEEIEAAAKSANCHNFISDLPEKYNTNVGEGGAQLSGGQKQRIAIARALISDPKVILLDEATSALDTESEAIVQAALDKASEGRTTIIVAHRLTTVKNADTIVALKEGKVVEKGTHDELFAQRGVYFALVMLQQLAEVDGQEGEEDEDEEKKKETLMRTFSSMSGEADAEGAVEKVLAHRSSMKLKKQMSQQDSPVKKPEKSKDKEEIKKEEEEEDKVEPAPIGRLLKYNKPEWCFMIVGSFCSALVGGWPVAFAVILSEILGTFAATDKEKMKEDAIFWSCMFLVLGVVDAVGRLFSSYFFAIAGERLTTRMRILGFKAILRQDMEFFDDPWNTSGTLCARLSEDAAAIHGATSSRLNMMVMIIVTMVAALGLSFAYTWELTLLILGFAPFLMLAGMAQMQIFANFAEKNAVILQKASAWSSQAIMNIRTVATLGKEKDFWQKYADLMEGPHKKQVRDSNLAGVSFGLSMGTMMFAMAAAFYVGGILVEDPDKNLAPDDMFKAMMATMFGALMAGNMSGLAPDYAKAKIAAARLLKLIDRVPAIDSKATTGVKLDSVSGDISFKDVQFHYPNRAEVKVLQGLTLDIKSGQRVALIGSSGCGKSTSVALIERFYDAIAGSVTIDGTNMKDFNVQWIRSQIGIVSQEPVLFARSIKDNIFYGTNNVQGNFTDADVEEAAKNANIHSFVNSLPKGYDTMVGEKGTLISGGQKQRIAIARALIRNPKIMLLDEATSALDSESEKIVQEALDVAMKGRTSIIIAHRLSTIQGCDLIAVVQDGKIIEKGTHQELIAMRGAYFALNASSS